MRSQVSRELYGHDVIRYNVMINVAVLGPRRQKEDGVLLLRSKKEFISVQNNRFSIGYPMLLTDHHRDVVLASLDTNSNFFQSSINDRTLYVERCIASFIILFVFGQKCLVTFVFTFSVSPTLTSLKSLQPLYHKQHYLHGFDPGAIILVLHNTDTLCQLIYTDTFLNYPI